MIRRAIIVACNETKSGYLSGPLIDNYNFRNHLLSNLGGDWRPNEILSLINPTKTNLINSVNEFFFNADYSLFVFSGHGYINLDDRKRQYMELADDDISIFNVITKVKRQAIIIDACRGYYSEQGDLVLEGAGEGDPFSNFIGSQTTRGLFEKHVLNCEEGLTVLYSANENQTSLDSESGGAYIFSLLKICEIWRDNDNSTSKLSLRSAHKYGAELMTQYFETIQKPVMNTEKRNRWFPLAVKFTE